MVTSIPLMAPHSNFDTYVPFFLVVHVIRIFTLIVLMSAPVLCILQSLSCVFDGVGRSTLFISSGQYLTATPTCSMTETVQSKVSLDHPAHRCVIFGCLACAHGCSRMNSQVAVCPTLLTLGGTSRSSPMLPRLSYGSVMAGPLLKYVVVLAFPLD